MKLFLQTGEPGVRVRPRPSAEHAAMAAAAMWLAVVAVLDAMPVLIMILLFGVAPLIVATAAGERRTAIFTGAAVTLAIAGGRWDHIPGTVNHRARVAAVAVSGVMAMVLAGMRRRCEERAARKSAIAHATRLALLPPLPGQMTGVSVAVRDLSATREASVGGDLYEIIPPVTGSG